MNKNIISMTLLALLFASCERASENIPQEPIAISFSVNNEPITRTDEKNTFSQGDIIGIYTLENIEHFRYKVGSITQGKANLVPTTPVAILQPESGDPEISCFAYYPYRPTISEQENHFPIDLVENNSDLLFSEVKHINSSTENVTLNFSHILSLIELKMTISPDFFADCDADIIGSQDIKVYINGHSQGSVNIGGDTFSASLDKDPENASDLVFDVAETDNNGEFKINSFMIPGNYNDMNIYFEFTVSSTGPKKVFFMPLGDILSNTEGQIEAKAGYKYTYNVTVGSHGATKTSRKITKMGLETFSYVPAL